MDNGVRFEYKINNDVKRSKASVSLYIIIQRNGFITYNELIATSKPTKYKKDATDADSLAYIIANLKTGVLRQLILDNQGLIRYKYSEVIDPDKVTERTTDNSPSGITRAQAAYIPQAKPEIKPGNLVELYNLPDPRLTKNPKTSGRVSFVEGSGNWTDTKYLASKLNSGNPEDNASKSDQITNNTNTNTNTTNNYTSKDKNEPFTVSNLAKDGSLTTLSDKKGTSTINNNQSTNITNSANTTITADDSSKATLKQNIEALANYTEVLKPENAKYFTKAELTSAAAEAKKLDKVIKEQKAKYNKDHPEDNTYRTEAEIKKEQLKKEVKNTKTDTKLTEKKKETKTQEPTASELFAEKAKENELAEKKKADKTDKPSTDTKKVSAAAKITPAGITEGNKETPVDSSATAKIKLMSDQAFAEVKPVSFDEPTKKLIEEDPYITPESEKKKSAAAVPPPIIKKKTTNPTPALQETETKKQKEQRERLASIDKSVKNVAGNTAASTSTDIKNIITNQAADKSTGSTNNKQQQSNEKPMTKPKGPKSDSGPVDNSQSALNSQLLNAIYDLLSTGIKVKY
jgi:hypothetical protein